jgi:putative transposase
MPRQPRLNLPGLYYHLIVRGIERRRIFRKTSDYLDFLTRLGENLVASGCRCFAWALMPNHIHLLLLSGIRGLVDLMHPLLTGYAVTFNLKYRRVGYLFQNRYKSIICQEDPYFLELVRYIGLNAVRAGLVNTPEELVEYPWSSHGAMMGRRKIPWLEKDAVLSRFGSTTQSATLAYERFMLEGWNQGHQERLEGGGLIRSLGGLEQAQKWSGGKEKYTSDVRILGDGNFVEEILGLANIQEQQKAEIQNSYSFQQLQDAIASRTGVDPEALLSTDRTRSIAEARAMLAYAASEGLGWSGKEIGQWLTLSSGGVSQARDRGKRLAEKMDLMNWLKTKKLSPVPSP